MTDPTRDRPGSILEYAEAPTPEPWSASAVLGVLAGAVVLGGVMLLVIELLAYLFS